MADASEDDGWPTHYTTRDCRRLARIPYGAEPDIRVAKGQRCYDCRVAKGEYHVGWLCGLERCPNCGGQFMSCDCDFVGDEGETGDA